jgi:serine protease AprX
MRIKSIILLAALVMSLVTPPFGLMGARAEGTIARQAAIDPKLQAVLANSTSPVEVIVTFRGKGAPAEANLNLLKSAGIQKGLTFRALPMAGVLATAEQINQLAASPDVQSIYLNQQLSYENDTATALTGVDKTRTDADMTKLNGGLPVSGKGIGVLINDSGVDGTHNDLKYNEHLVQNVAGAANLHAIDTFLPVTYAEDVPNTDSTGGHGTHVAGIVGGTGAMSNGKYEGVAPGADLIGYGSGAALFMLDTLGGFDYALTHQFQYNIRVVTNSWGNTGDVGTPFDPNDPTNIATYELYKRGVAVVFSAGNSGPGEDTITGNFKKAPWVITVAAGDKQGRLADFSSRGMKDRKGSVMIEGTMYTWEDRPTFTAPGVDIVSTRVIAPVSSLAPTDDVNLEPAYIPYYTTMSGTSMAAPHAAGIVALMLDANPALSPDEVKQILQETATNIPGGEAWETGAGYVNAYATVDASFQQGTYGKTVNLLRNFNSDAKVSATSSSFTVDYNPVAGSSNRYAFTVPAGQSELVARINAYGIEETTGNPINLVLIGPDGTEYSSGISVLFALYPDRTVSVTTPQAGNWTVQLRGLQGAAGLPEQVQGTLTFKMANGFTGLNDIAGHPAAEAIKLGVSERLLDGYADGSFKPNQALTRVELAQYLTMGAEIRQASGSTLSFADVKREDLPFVRAVTAKGAALRDASHLQNGVMLATENGNFAPKKEVTRLDLAYALVQSLGLQEEAVQRNQQTLTVQYGDQRLLIEDAANIPEQLRGYVQLALDLNILNAYFSVTQGPYDLSPTVHAVFNPAQKVTRGDYAVAISRFFSAFLAP